MELRRALGVSLALVAASHCVGCRSPIGAWLTRSSTPASAANSPAGAKYQYDGLAKNSAGAAGETAAAAKTTGNFFTNSWNSTTGAVAAVFKSKAATPTKPDATSLSTSSKKTGPDVYIAAGRLYESQEKWDEAAAQYETALKADPKNLTAWLSIARLHDRAGRVEQAFAAYQTALKANPKNSVVHNDIGLCYLNHQDPAHAVPMLKKAVELEPSKASYRTNFATALVQTGRADEAYQQLAAVNTQAVAHYNLGHLLLTMNKREEAEKHLRQAVSLDGSLTQAKEMLAQLDSSAGNAVAATALQVQPVNNTRNRLLGRRGKNEGVPGVQAETLTPPDIQYGGDESPAATGKSPPYPATSTPAAPANYQAPANEAEGGASIYRPTSFEMEVEPAVDDSAASPTDDVPGEAAAATAHVGDDEAARPAADGLAPVVDAPRLLPVETP